MSRLLATYDNYISFEFGNQILQGNPIFHDGIDLVGETYQGWHALDEIKCHTAGTVIEADYDDGRGNHLCIAVADNVYMTYNHLESMYVGVGDYVNQGQVIGYMGATGGCTGAHLHWGINDNGEWVDPTDYLETDYVKGDANMTRQEKEIITHSCYVETLGRPADPSGLDAYCGIIPDNADYFGYDRNIINNDLRGSDEYKRNFIRKCYNVFLGREPENEEVIDMRMSLSFQEITDIIMNSEEAKNRAN